MPKYAMIYDAQKCIGCQSCTIACKSENNVPEGFFRLQVKIKGPFGTSPNLHFKFERHSCEMCENTPCVSVCPTDALVFGDLNAPNDSIHQILAQKPHFTRKAHLGTKPKLFVLPENKGGISYE